MACDMISFCTSSSAVFPLASEAEVVCALSAYVVIAEMIVEGLWVDKRELTVEPLTRMSVVVVVGLWGSRGMVKVNGSSWRGRKGGGHRVAVVVIDVVVVPIRGEGRRHDDLILTRVVPRVCKKAKTESQESLGFP